MSTATTWAPATTGKYRVTEPAGSREETQLHTVPTPRAGAAAAASPINPENPLFWFAGIAAVTFGLMAFSTSVRVGKTTASVNLGSTK